MEYNLLKISSENADKEQQVIQEIFQCIKNEESWYFDAGAGAGKTYALIQSLKMIVSEKGNKLNTHNQKIMCITYTNVAANEIKERLGKTVMVDVSTIHDCIWNILAQHQELLLVVHKEKLLDEVDKSKKSLLTERWAEKYVVLTKEEKKLLFDVMTERKAEYYRHKGDRANEFRAIFQEIDTQFSGLMSSVDNFKKIVDKLFLISRYEDAISKIDIKAEKYRKVKYDARFNDDRLDKMLISHDTLLEYMQKMVVTSDLLKQIICDKYPFVLVDEYQDTDPLVIDTLDKVSLFAKKIGHPFVVGYYGDIKQNIYEKGVGSRFREYSTALKRIEKVFNRRCSPQVIKVANQVRNDGLEQESIYEEFPEGEVSFYNISMERKDIIDTLVRKWRINSENQLHCFELTNEYVAEQSGFSEFYAFFKNSKWYKMGKHYEFLRDHVLSLDENKLGTVQKVLYRILDFKCKINCDETMLLDIFSSSNMKSINISELRKIIEILQNIDGATLEEYLNNLYDCYNRGEELIDSCIEYVIAENICSFEQMKKFVLNQLYYFIEGEEVPDDKKIENEQTVVSFLRLDMSIFERWYQFITDSYKGSVVYHTYHSTKGREFENVLIIMNSKFGKNATFFKDLLNVLPQNNEDDEMGTQIEVARNLLYVAITRAIRNLCIVYLDNLDDVQDNVTSVFGEIKTKIE